MTYQRPQPEILAWRLAEPRRFIQTVGGRGSDAILARPESLGYLLHGADITAFAPGDHFDA